MHMHTYTHAHTDFVSMCTCARVHAPVPACVSTCSHMRAHVHVHACMCTHMCTHTGLRPACVHVCTRACKHMSACTCIHMCTHLCTCTSARTHMWAHVCMHEPKHRIPPVHGVKPQQQAAGLAHMQGVLKQSEKRKVKNTHRDMLPTPTHLLLQAASSFWREGVGGGSTSLCIK